MHRRLCLACFALQSLYPPGPQLLHCNGAPVSEKCAVCTKVQPLMEFGCPVRSPTTNERLHGCCKVCLARLRELGWTCPPPPSESQ